MKRKEALCIFGVDLAEAKMLFSAWIDEDPSRKIVLLEEATLPILAWQLLLFDLQLANPPSLSEEKRELGKALFEKLKFWQIGAEALLADVKDRGKKVVGNMLANLPFLEGAFAASSLMNNYRGIPALICGAGPSMQRHLPQLQDAAERMLVFAGGTALKVVAEGGITPHFAAALDPDSPVHLFSSEATKDIPFFFPLRLAAHILPEVQGPRIWAADGISYPLESWLVEQFGLDEPSIEGGWNVATFSISLAAMMGCNPIVLVGVDLCLPEGKSYTSGVDHSYANDHLLETTQGLTKGDFLLAADWIASFKQKHPTIHLINVAKEAWPIDGVEHSSLEALLGQFSQHGISAIPDASLGPQLHLSLSPSEVLKDWKKSLTTANDHCAHLIALLERNFPSDPRQFGNYVLSEVELEQEPAVQFLLEPIWRVWKPLFNQAALTPPPCFGASGIYGSDEGFAMDCKEGDLFEPYLGFRETVQKWLFWKSIIKELNDAVL